MESSDMNPNCATDRTLMQGQGGPGRSKGREVRHALTVAPHVDTVFPHPALPCPCGHVVGAHMCAERGGSGSSHPARRPRRRSRGEGKIGPRRHGHCPWTPAGTAADAPPFHCQSDAGGVRSAHGRSPSRPRTGIPHGPRRLPGTPVGTSARTGIFCRTASAAMVRIARSRISPACGMRNPAGPTAGKGVDGPPHSGTLRNRHADLTPADCSADVVAMRRIRPWVYCGCGIPPQAAVPSCPAESVFRFPSHFPSHDVPIPHSSLPCCRAPAGGPRRHSQC